MSTEAQQRAIEFALAIRERLTIGTVSVDIPVDQPPVVMFTAKVRGVQYGMSQEFCDTFIILETPVALLAEKWEWEIRAKVSA